MLQSAYFATLLPNGNEAPNTLSEVGRKEALASEIELIHDKGLRETRILLPHFTFKTFYYNRF